MNEFKTELPLSDLPLFVEVVRQQSYSKASQVLGVPKSTISRRITALEKKLGVKLLYRDSRKVQPTLSGQNFYQRCVYLVEEAHNAFESVKEDATTPTGLVRLATLSDLFFGILAPVLCEFSNNWPEIQLEVHFIDRPVDLHLEQFDINFRVGEQPDSSLIARKIGTGNLSLFAAPNLLAQFSPITAIDDLKEVPSIIHGTIGNLGSLWNLTNGVEEVQVKMKKRHFCSTLSGSAAFALAGLGVALLPEILGMPFVQRGRLVHLLPEWTTVNKPLYLVMPNKDVPLRVRLLADFIVGEFDSMAKGQRIVKFEDFA